MSSRIDGDPPTISIIRGGAEMLDRIEPLWLALRKDHFQRFPLWRETLRHASFGDRKTELLRKSGGGLLALLGQLETVAIAYCICTIDAERHGEVDSIFVAPTHRHRGISTAFMRAALKWLSDHHAERITIDVMAANDPALRFYERLGFVPRTIRLERPSERPEPRKS